MRKQHWLYEPFFLLVISILVFSLLLPGCGGKEAVITEPSPETSAPEITTTSPPATTPSVSPETTPTSPSATTPAGTGKTYYVKNGGNDNASGLSDAEAWATLSKVQNSSFNPGDKILLKCGSTWNERLEFPSSGSPGNDILFSSYGTGDQPKMMRLNICKKQYITISNIYMLADRDYEAIFVIYSNDITIDGVTNDGQKTMDNNRCRVTQFDHAYNIIIRNSTIKDGGNQIGTVGGGGLGIEVGCHDMLVENNLVYNHAEFGIQTCDSYHSEWIYNITIRGNTIYNEEGYFDGCVGINVGWHSHDVIVEDNTVTNTMIFCISTDADVHDVIIRNNLMLYTLDSGYFNFTSFIDILSCSDGENHNSFVYNNSMFHLSRIAGVAFITIRPEQGSSNTGHKIFNNLCVSYNPDVAFIKDCSYDADNPNARPSEFTSDYNLFYTMGIPGPFIYRNVRYNTIEEWREKSGQDMHTIYANPLLKGIENYDDNTAFTTAGDELISNPSFAENTNGWDSYFHTQGGASGSISRTTSAGEYAASPGGLKVTCNTNGNNDYDIQLSNTIGMHVENNKWYILSFKAKASSQFIMHDIGFGQMQSPYAVYCSRKLGDNPVITTDWKTYHVFILTNQAASDARIIWYLSNSLPEEGTFYIDDVSFKLADGLNNVPLPDIEDFVTPVNSPCVDAGVTLADVTEDILGNHRPRGAGYDIGAYECQ
jgi:hypothetical protein